MNVEYCTANYIELFGSRYFKDHANATSLLFMSVRSTICAKSAALSFQSMAAWVQPQPDLSTNSFFSGSQEQGRDCDLQNFDTLLSQKSFESFRNLRVRLQFLASCRLLGLGNGRDYDSLDMACCNTKITYAQGGSLQSFTQTSLTVLHRHQAGCTFAMGCILTPLGSCTHHPRRISSIRRRAFYEMEW